ncbi:MAG: sodium ion-translocating decarboxylase subunit beta [Clostridia bacterium]|nr:sodium ion-translocating decarboxylase subunit beta [Clostridia bacterium]
MKVKIFLILGFIGILIFSHWHHQHQAIGIIGGADGPTTIFLASRLSTSSFLAIIILTAIVLIGMRLRKKR